MLPLLRAKFWQNKTATPAPGELRVAIHMRRGDVSADDKKVANNFTPNATFVNTLTRLKALAGQHRAGAAHRDLLARRGRRCSPTLRALGAELRLDEPALDTHRGARRSRYPRHVEGRLQLHRRRLNDGITLYDPQKYRALQDWVVRAPDGSFDEAPGPRASRALRARCMQREPR